MKDLVIIGGKAPESLGIDISSYKRIIAADSGYDTAKRLGIKPTDIVGDFDSTSFSAEILSLGYKPCSRDKDDTDAAIAIKAAGDVFDIIGGGEGRIDHTLSLLIAFRTMKAPAQWFLRSDTLRLVSESVSFTAPSGTDVSIIPVSSAVVTTHGLRWDIDGVELSDFFISQSNRVEGNKAEIKTTAPVFLRFFPEDYHKVVFNA